MKSENKDSLTEIQIKERTERLKKAYNRLVYEGVVKKHEDVAKAMGATRPSVSAALSGDARFLTLSFLMGQNEPLLSDAAVYNYHKNLKGLIRRALFEGKISVNPYDRLRGQLKRGEKESVEYLTEDEIAAFMSLQPVAGTMMAVARDLFVFQLFTGFGYTDAQNFDISGYKQVDGKWVSIVARAKTGVPTVSQLLPPAVEVLEKYGMEVPKIGNADYNHCLKALGMAAGISTPLHSHLARHTFATFMLRNGVKVENLARMMGHRRITQTMRYAKVLAQSVHEDFDMVEQILKKGGH